MERSSYADEETPSRAKPMSDLMKGAMARFTFTGSAKQITEYSDLINTGAKLTKQPYIVFHKRIEKTFPPKSSPDTVLSYLRQWTHEAEKHPNPGMIMNARMKKYRETNAPPKV